ncbi:MAG: hypothetical protein PF961_20880 [Planctomycetota bacterium]|jgi:hypothetical protein|nr:hypothetical protein [Planctomycetota bacterium]
MNLVAGLALLGVAGLMFVMWLIISLWDYSKRGEDSGIISKAGYKILADNVGKQRRLQWRAIIFMLVGLVVAAIAIGISLAIGGPRWASW